jgi:hypothetical protein
MSCGPINSTGGTTAIAIPCVQNLTTPAGPVPTPLLNVSITISCIPNVLKTLYAVLPFVNQLTENPISTGSVPAGGVVTGGICLDSQNISWSTVLNIEVFMVTTMLDATGHDRDFNSFGAHLTPSPPVKVFVMR